MNNEQLQIFLDSHGTDPAHWPFAQRDAVNALIAHNAEARALFEAARQFDSLLARAQAPSPGDETSAARIMARLGHLPRQTQPFWRWPAVLLDWQFAPAWPRMAALASCAAIGFMVGIAGLERYETSLTVTSQGGITSLFEPEPLTGARP